ncbi:MAG TPA: ABC transporter permease [Burkholderiaceae bacterium]|nr:ABC transporter permease [Burkholderiaceae bacterium]
MSAPRFELQGLRLWWGRLRVMTVKELLQLLRDPVLLFVILYGFTADIYNAGSGVTLQLTNASMAVQDLDRSAASRELVSRFLPPEFNVGHPITRDSEASRLLDDGDALLVMTIPPQFERDLLSGRRTDVQMQIDATNSVLGFLAYSYGTQIITSYALEAGLLSAALGGGAASQAPVVDNRVRVWFNPNQNDAWFMSISELLNVITAFSILLPAAAMVREKERGTIEQLLVSPLTPMQVMLPKTLAMMLVIHLGIVLSLLTVLLPIFHVPIQGSLPLFFFITTLYIITLSGLGLFIATVTRNLAQAAMLSILVLAPMIFLSGIWTPPEAMPAAVRAMMVISPLYYYMDACYGILLKGAGLDSLWDAVLGIVVLGCMTVGFGLWRFRRQFD